MDTSVNAINSISSSAATTNTQDKNAEKIKEMAAKYDFDYFDVDNDGKLSGVEVTKLKAMFNSVDFDTDDEEAIDESSFNSALSDYQE